MGAKANNLFHFTKSIDALKGILVNGFMPRYCLEDTRHIEIEYVSFPMTCFCDIPLSRISDHTAFYGEYGLGMTKEWGLKNGLAPIIYTPATGVIPSLANFILDLKTETAIGDLKLLQDELGTRLLDLLSFVKPLSGKMIVGGTAVEKDFYQENEWRYVPQPAEPALRPKFETEKQSLDKQMEQRKLAFVPGDVKYIYVKNDTEIPGIFDFIQNNMGQYPHNEIKILTSRIISLETISRDL